MAKQYVDDPLERKQSTNLARPLRENDNVPPSAWLKSEEPVTLARTRRAGPGAPRRS